MMHCEAISSLCSFQDYKRLWICKSILYKLCLLQDWGYEGLLGDSLEPDWDGGSREGKYGFGCNVNGIVI